MASSTLGTGFFQPQARPGGVTIATERLAEEIGPFMKDYLEREAALATLRTEGFRDEETGELVLDPVTGEPIDPGGYKAFTGPTIAEFTPEQLEAQRGLAGLAGFDISVDPTTGERTVTQTGPGITADRFAEAEALIRGQPEEFTGDVAEKFMSPFQQAVVDIEKREAQQKFEQEVLPKVQAAAIQSGSFGGSRGALLESEALRGQGQLLSDIQRKGSQAAYDRGLKAFEMQKGREAATAQGLTGLATGEFGQRAKELSGIERVGALQQQQTQTALDEAYKEFLEEQAFPESVLDRMQAAAFGFPAMRQEVRQSPTTFGPSTFANLASTVGSIGAGVGSLFGQLGGQKAAPNIRKRGGLISRRDGGLVPLVRRQSSGDVVYGGTRVDPTRPTTENTLQNQMLAAIRNRQTVRERAALQREEIARQQAERAESHKARLVERADPWTIFLRSLRYANQIPEGKDARDFPLGFNVQAVSQDITDTKDALEKEYRTLEEQGEDAKLAAMQADITRMEQQSEQDVRDIERQLPFSQDKREEKKVALKEKEVFSTIDYNNSMLNLKNAQNKNDLFIAKQKLVQNSQKLIQDQTNKDRTYELNIKKLENAIRATDVSSRKVVLDLMKDNKFKDSLSTGYNAYALNQLEQAKVSKEDAIKILTSAILGQGIGSDLTITPNVDGTIKDEDRKNAKDKATKLVTDFRYGE